MQILVYEILEIRVEGPGGSVWNSREQNHINIGKEQERRGREGREGVKGREGEGRDKREEEGKKGEEKKCLPQIQAVERTRGSLEGKMGTMVAGNVQW